jgi:hypothetical protein
MVAKSTVSKIWLIGFIVGVCAMMAFHQGTLHILHHHAAKVPMLTDFIGRFPRAYDFTPLRSNGVPLLVVLGVWGGVWGIIIATLVRLTRLASSDLPLGLLFGAFAITFVETTELPALLGLPRLPSGNEQAILRAALLNGAFGFGTVFFLRPFAVRG